MDTIALFEVFEEESDSDGIDHRSERLLTGNSADIFQMNDKDFQRNFRLNKAAFQYVLTEYESAARQSQRQSGLTGKHILAACLRFFAEGSYQHSVGKDFHINIAQPTFYLKLSELLNALEGPLCSKWISLDMTTDEERNAKTTFFERYGIPGVAMAVDGTHVKITAPKENKHLFYNRKGYYSINVMLICDHNQRIKFVSAQYPGSCHDSHIWEQNAAIKYI